MQTAANAYLAGFGDALTVLGHSSSYPVQTSCNHPGKRLGCLQFSLTTFLALPEADLQQPLKHSNTAQTSTTVTEP